MNEKDLKIQELTEKLKQAEEKLEYTKTFIEQKCVYDDHLVGYCFDLKKGDVRRLMYKLKEDKKEE